MARLRRLVMKFFVLGWACAGLAQGVPPGVDAASFARIGLGVRALGMAGAYVAVAEGPAAGYWNPAGLSGLVDFQTEGMYTNWLGADIHFRSLGLAGSPPLGDPRPALVIRGVPATLALNWLMVRVADIPWVEEDGAAGVFDAWSHLVSLSLAFPLSSELSLGVSAKIYHDRILEGQSLGVGLDVGLLWHTEVTGVPMRVGVSTTNLGGTKVRWYGTTGEPENFVPWLIRVGAAAELLDGMVLLSGSFERGLDRPRFERIRAGVEVRLEWLALRAGWDQPLFGEAGSWSVGLGVTPWPWATLEYAILPRLLGTSHLISLKLAF